MKVFRGAPARGVPAPAAPRSRPDRLPGSARRPPGGDAEESFPAAPTPTSDTAVAPPPLRAAALGRGPGAGVRGPGVVVGGGPGSGVRGPTGACPPREAAGAGRPACCRPGE